MSQRDPVSASWGSSALQLCFASLWDAVWEGADGSGESRHGGVGSLIEMVQSPALKYLDHQHCCCVLQGVHEQLNPGISVQIWANLGLHICVPGPGGGEPGSSSLPNLPGGALQVVCIRKHCWERSIEWSFHQPQKMGWTPGGTVSSPLLLSTVLLFQVC